MSSEPDPEVLSRTMLIGAVVATITLLLLGLPWPVAMLAGVGGFVVSRSTARRVAARRDDESPQP